ncbi:MAG: hypothetical protein WCI71_05920 [Bacteroidota bacterium]
MPACKKQPPAADYPQLIGRWTGSTTQDQSFRLTVENFDGVLYITYYRLVVVFNTGGSRTLEQNKPDGIARITDRYFNIPMSTGIYGPGYVEGTFNLNTMLLSGTFRVYNPSVKDDFITGFLTAGR